jgi:protein SCO1/2
VKIPIACLVLVASAVPAAAATSVSDARVATALYRVPDVRLVRDDGRTVTLAGELDHAGPVALNFVFTTCSAICPIQSRVFADLQQKAGPGLRLLSISLDPLNDTPEQLREYGRRFGAGGEWRFYTGTPQASSAAQRAFDVYRGNKMNHEPVVLLRRGPGQPWMRVEGYPSADDLLRALRGAPGGRKIQYAP